MSDAGEIIARLRMDDSQWNATLDRAEARAAELNGVDPVVRVRADTVAASAALTSVKEKVDAVAAAEGKLAAAQSVWERTTNQATLAEMRLDGVRKNSRSTTLQLASATEAYRFANEKAVGSAGRLAAAESALSDARKHDAEAAVEENAATDAVTKSQARGQRQSADWRSSLIGGLVAVSAAAPPVAAAAIGLTGAFGAMGVAGVLGLAGIARGLKENNEIGLQYRGTVATLLSDVHSLQDSAAKGLLPGVDRSTTLLTARMPVLNGFVQHFAAMLGADLPVGLDATVTLTERAVPLFNAAGGYLGRMVQGLDDFSHSRAYGDFLAYSIKSLPEVEHFLGSTVHLLGDFLAAWAPLGTTTLPLLDHLITGLDDIVRHTGPLVPGIIAVVGAYKLLSPAIGIVKALTASTVALGGAESGAPAATGGLATGWTVALLAATQYAAFLAAHQNFEQTYDQTSGSPARKSAVAAMSSRASTTAPSNAGGGGMDLGLGAGFDALAAKRRAATAATKTNTAADERAATATKAVTVAVESATVAWQKNAASIAAASSKYQAQHGTLLSAEDAINSVSAAVKLNGTSLANNTSKGRANQEMLLSAVQTIQAHGAALNADGKHTAAAAVSNDRMAMSLINSAVKAGISRKAAEAYVNKLLGIPANRTTTMQLNKDVAQAKLEAFKARWDAIQSKTVTLFGEASYSANFGTIARAALRARGGTAGEPAGVTRAAVGATVRGPGTAATDTAGLYALANGEEITSNLFGQADRFRPLLKAINAGTVRTMSDVHAATGGGTQHVHMHFTDDGSDSAQKMRAVAEAVVAAQQSDNQRTLRMGWQPRGQLA